MSLIIICGAIFKKGFGLNKSHRLHDNKKISLMRGLILFQTYLSYYMYYCICKNVKV